MSCGALSNSFAQGVWMPRAPVKLMIWKRNDASSKRIKSQEHGIFQRTIHPPTTVIGKLESLPLPNFLDSCSALKIDRAFANGERRFAQGFPKRRVGMTGPRE